MEIFDKQNILIGGFQNGIRYNLKTRLIRSKYFVYLMYVINKISKGHFLLLDMRWDSMVAKFPKSLPSLEVKDSKNQDVVKIANSCGFETINFIEMS